MKSGQIAHLDRDSANNSEANLAFLCFDHHDEYDSTSSQRKNFTVGEVKEFREELYTTINKAFTQQVHFGEIKTSPLDPYAGSYIRTDSGIDSAELELVPLPDSWEGEVQYYVSGLALWGAGRFNGPNLGTLEFVGVMNGDRQIIYSRTRFNDEVVSTKIVFHGNGELDVTEENWLGEYGMNVTFEGHYERAG